MLYSTLLAPFLFVSLAAAAGKAAGGKDAGPSVAETDVGSILKSMDQTKLSSIPADARAVMKKMPETPDQVTAADRSAIANCISNPAVDALGKDACSAQKDQISAVIDNKKRVSTANMAKFVTEAKAAGATIPDAKAA